MTGASGGRPAHRNLAGGVAGAMLLAAPALAAEPAAEIGSGFLGRLFDRVGQVWVVDAPGAAGSRFSLGASLFFEHQESLRFAFQETAVTSPGPAGQPVVTVVVADPELLGRKFDPIWELLGAGVEVPVALPAIGGAVYPTLVLQAGGADFELELVDRASSADSVTLSGDGAQFGVGADLAAPLCAGCPWLGFAGLRYQWLPETDVDRGVPFELASSPGGPGAGPPLFEALVDETRLRREAREISGRLAYGLPGSRVLPFAGVRHRWIDLKIDGELAFRSPVAAETRLQTRTRLESETTLALAGFDFQLGPRLFGSFETAASEDDYGAALRVVALLQGPGLWEPPPPEEQAREARRIAAELAPRPAEIEEQTPEARRIAAELASRPAEIEEQAREARRIAAELAPHLAEIEAAFRAGRAALTLTVGPDGESAYLAAEVEALLARTEADLLAVLGEYPELEALADWVRDRFEVARAVLAGSPPAASPSRVARAASGSATPMAIFTATAPGPRSPTRVVAQRGPRWRPAQDSGGATVPKPTGDAALDIAERTVSTPRRRAEDGRLQTYLAFATTLGPGTGLRIYPRFNPSAAVVLPRNPPRRFLRRPAGAWIYVGSYSFEVLPGPADLTCDANDPRIASCPLDLVSQPPSVLCCTEHECRPEECL